MKGHLNLKGFMACVCGALFIYVTILAILTSNGLAALRADFDSLIAHEVGSVAITGPLDENPLEQARLSFSKDDIPAIEIDSQRDVLTGFPSSWNDNSIVVVVDLGRPSDPESYFFELDCVSALYIHGRLFDLTGIQTASITKKHLPMPLEEECDED